MAGEQWVLMPASITLEMQRAYFDVIDANMPRVTTDARFGRHDSNAQAYRAMIDATPRPQLSDAEVERAAEIYRNAWVRMPSVNERQWADLSWQEKSEHMQALLAALQTLGLTGGGRGV